MMAPIRPPHAFRDSFQLLAEELELTDLALNDNQLFVHQSAEFRPDRGTGVQSSREQPEPFQRESKRARTADEADPVDVGLSVLSIPGRGAARKREDTDLLVIPDRFRGHAGHCGDLADGERVRHATLSFDVRR
jgi:hypothetical protein